MNTKQAIQRLLTQINVKNDAYYWDLCRTYGEYSMEVLRHLQACSYYQRGGY